MKPIALVTGASSGIGEPSPCEGNSYMSGIESWFLSRAGGELADGLLSAFRKDPFVSALHQAVDEWNNILPVESSICINKYISNQHLKGSYENLQLMLYRFHKETDKLVEFRQFIKIWKRGYTTGWAS